MPRPVHFEIHATDPNALREFYEKVFDWRFQQWGDVPYWLISTASSDGSQAPGIDGGLVPRRGAPPEDGQPVNAFVLTVDVPDCAAYVERAVEAGASVALPRHATPGVGWLAYVKDPDGNLIGLMQNDPTAS